MPTSGMTEVKSVLNGVDLQQFSGGAGNASSAGRWREFCERERQNIRTRASRLQHDHVLSARQKALMLRSLQTSVALCLLFY